MFWDENTRMTLLGLAPSFAIRRIMGTTINVHCTRCDRRGVDLSWGEGMHHSWLYFEHRLFHCRSCETLQTVRVLKHKKDLEDAFEDDPEEFDRGAGQMTRKELAKLLIEARRWPRCSFDECGGRLSGSQGADSKGQASSCPACKGRLQVEEAGLLWD